MQATVFEIADFSKLDQNTLNHFGWHLECAKTSAKAKSYSIEK